MTRPDLAALRAEVIAAEADLALANRTAMPDLQLGVQYSHEVDKDVVLGTLTIALPLFHRNAGARRSARAAVKRARLVEESARRDAERKLRRACR